MTSAFYDDLKFIVQVALNLLLQLSSDRKHSHATFYVHLAMRVAKITFL